MLEVLVGKQVDIYISLATSLIGAIFGIWLDRTTKRGAPPPRNSEGGGPSGISVTQVTLVSLDIRTSGQSQSVEPLVFVFIIIAGIIYLFFRTEVLAVGALGVFLLIGVWVGTVIHSLYRGDYRGWQWGAYLIFMLLFGVAAFGVETEAITPFYAPENFRYAQQIAQKGGISAVGTYFGFQNLPWFISHLGGVVLFFFACSHALLAMLFYSIAGNRMVLGKHSHGGWLLGATARYGRPVRNIVVFSVFLALAYFMVSGRFYLWYVNDLPVQINHMIQYVLHGSRGA